MLDPIFAEDIDGSSIYSRSFAVRQRDNVSNLVIAGFVAASVYLLVYGVFYPGLINFDTAEMLNQAVSNYCRDWHSPAIVVLWRLLNHLAQGPAVLLGAGLLLYSVAALYFAQASTTRLAPCVAALLLLCLWPPILDDLALVGKDQLFLASFMLFVALLFGTLKEGRLTAGSLFWLIPLLFLAAGVRQDSAAILVPPLALLYRLRWGWRVAGPLALASVIVAFVAVKGFNGYVAHAEKDFAVQTTLIHDLAGISDQTDHPLIPSYADPGFDLGEMKGRYTPRSGDPLMFDGSRPDIQITYDKRQAEELKTLWEKSVLRYPRAYLQHRFATFTYLIGIEEPMPYQLYQLDTDSNMHGVYPNLAEIDLSNPDNAAVSFYRQEIVPALGETPMFRGYAYDLVILFGMALALYRRRPLQDRLIVALGCGALLHQWLLFFASPAALFRYLYPSVLTCLVIVLLTLTRATVSEK